MTEEALARVRELIEVLRHEGARHSLPGPFFEVAKILEGWLAVPGRNRGKPREVMASFAAWAMVATREARADRETKEKELRRRACWRCVFLMAAAFELDPFERPEQMIEPEPTRRRGGNLLPGYDGPRCAGVRKDGRPCRGIPRQPSQFCYLHEGQAAEPVAEPVAVDQGLDAPEPAAIGQELDPAEVEAAFDERVDRWLADARRAMLARKED